MSAGVAPQVSSRRMRRVRGRGPGRRAGPVGVAHTGSTARTPGERTAEILTNSKSTTRLLVDILIPSRQCEASL